MENKMEHRYKVIVSGINLYREFEIPSDVVQIKLGTSSSCELRLDKDAFIDNVEMVLVRKTGGFLIVCPEGMYISGEGIRKLYSTEVGHGDDISICYDDMQGTVAFKIRFRIDFETFVPNYNWKINISACRKIIISDLDEADLMLSGEFSKDNAAIIERRDSGLWLEEVKSRFGVNLNSKQIKGPALLKDHDFFSIADSFFYLNGEDIYFDKRSVSSPVHMVTTVEKEGSFSYPLFVRNTRVKVQMDTEEIQILDPSALPAKPKVNYVTSLLPALIMFALVVVLRGIMSTTGGTFVIFSICSMGLGVVTSILNIVYSKKDYREALNQRFVTYNDYIKRKKEEIAAAREKEIKCLERTYRSVKEDIQVIEEFQPSLFDRTPMDDDFLDVYLGRGRVESAQKITYKAQEALEIGDDLAVMPCKIAEEYKFLDNAPVVLSLKNANAVGVVSDEKTGYELFKNMLIDICTRQYYREVRVFTLLPDEHQQYDWIKHLPHITHDGMRNIVCDNESKNYIFEELFKDLDFRSRKRDKNQHFVFNVVFVLDERGIKKHPISRFIEHASELDTVFIFFERKKEYLPLYCTKMILANGLMGEVFDSSDEMRATRFSAQEISDVKAERVSKRLAPVRCEEISLEGALRKSISLFELMGIYSPEDVDLKKAWNTSEVEKSMAVPLGVNVKDEIIYLDLNEKYHGPHGLVAGTTGSGKSEVLLTYVIGAAMKFRPTEVSFLIIDFKGGDLVKPFMRLPHLVGAITNLEGKTITRSLKAIDAELKRRQRLFSKAGESIHNIDQYITAYKKGKIDTPLPHLIIIVDEFAELKSAHPEFMEKLTSAARIGRSIGVHLILATQKPAGQIGDQIWSNSKFKLCLKVQTVEDSNEVLKSPLAAEIREPGRAYLQVGNNEIFELFQSGFSGAPEKRLDVRKKAIKLYSMEFNGSRKLIFEQKQEKQEQSRNQLSAMVDYIVDYCEKNRVERAYDICLPPLPTEIIYDASRHSEDKDAVLSVPIGIFDDPDNQRQDIAILEPGKENVFILGSAQYGKTNILIQMIRYLSENYSPQEVNMYIIDFNSMVLKNFEDLKHVGGVVTMTDDEKLKNLFKLLTNEVARRREILLARNVSSFASYKEAGFTDLPQIIVFIDNLTMLKELYLQDTDILLTLLRDGISEGITFVVTNAQTNGIGYKYMANFASKVALFLNDSSEYSTMFGFSKIRPDETPGRGVIELDKSVYEYQSFIAFAGDREIERVTAMQKFVTEINAFCGNQYAEPIPEIPERLNFAFMMERYANRVRNADGIIVGLDYDTVLPVEMNLMKTSILGISGVDGSGKTNFVRCLFKTMLALNYKAEFLIFDDYRKKLKDFAKTLPACSYAFTGNGIKDVILNLEKVLEIRYQKLLNEEDMDDPWKVILLNNVEYADAISTDREANKAFKNIVGKYKELRILVIVNNIPNAQIPYGASDVMKMLRDGRQVLFFGDLDDCKVVDIPLSVSRNFKKKITTGDAYYIKGNECCKVKTPLYGELTEDI